MQFALIHGSNIPGSYAILFFTALDFSPPNTSTTEHLFHFGSSSSFFLELLVIVPCSSRVAYWTPSGLGDAYLLVSYLFTFSNCLWNSHSKNTGVYCCLLLQWTTFCQNSSLWLVCLGWSSTASLIASELCKSLHHARQGCDLWRGRRRSQR